ncbi:uncharacterized protein LOC126672648 [Mercurialis annua]|uniref:uncharacterized protein LOC126672648 n=1 Tax=Mercurialis annua TaxID=3986 RepID=UPI00215E5C1A|nr:uncharacterized protein LOC126672648 [Mercurialis annua]
MLNRDEINDIFVRVDKIRNMLNKLQSDIQADPFNSDLQDEERALSKHFHKMLSWEENILRQESKMMWIKLGDYNTKFYHRLFKQRQARKRIVKINNAYGNVVDDPELSFAEEKDNLNAPFDDKEIRATMFGINGDKAPWPDGFGSAFFKKSWSKIISASQSGFVTGKNIFDNILLTHELVRNYHKNKGNSCALNIDLHKAYDTIKTVKYSIQINGEVSGYFDGGRGLRQGDPISPLIFVLCIDYLLRSPVINTRRDLLAKMPTLQRGQIFRFANVLSASLCFGNFRNAQITPKTH